MNQSFTAVGMHEETNKQPIDWTPFMLRTDQEGLRSTDPPRMVQANLYCTAVVIR